ncbi:MAG: hypothetical protein JNJ41_12460 [Bacteroidia bacterium]|nr:hypothetical protein [Bacteroidia bacterium]
MAKTKTNPIKTQYNEVLDLIVKVANGKGWSTSIQNKDTKSFKYANVHISKFFPQNYSGETVTGNIDIDVVSNKSVKLQFDKTSFYGYGLESLASALREEIKELPWLKTKAKETPSKETTSFQIIEQILNKIDRSVRQLKRRHDQRSTIEVKDEYDIQDLLHAVLKCYFDDVRPEEYCPSYAGSSSRIDFLLKKEKIIIEAKYASSRLKDKKIGEQLIIDIKRYETHPDCETLFCFVYDPDGNIQNPTALENDLTGQHGKNNFNVKVIISPK